MTFQAAAIVVYAVLTMLTGCSPTFDWRTVTDTDQRYTVDMPAKPVADARDISVSATRLTMRMRAATAGGAVFAVGTVSLPNDDPHLASEVLAYLQRGLARNIGARPVSRATHIRVGDGGQTTAIAFDASGTVAREHTRRTIHACFVVHDQRIYQAAIIAAHDPAPEQMHQFFDSLRLD